MEEIKYGCGNVAMVGDIVRNTELGEPRIVKALHENWLGNHVENALRFTCGLWGSRPEHYKLVRRAEKRWVQRNNFWFWTDAPDNAEVGCADTPHQAEEIAYLRKRVADAEQQSERLRKLLVEGDAREHQVRESMNRYIEGLKAIFKDKYERQQQDLHKLVKDKEDLQRALDATTTHKLRLESENRMLRSENLRLNRNRFIDVCANEWLLARAQAL